MIYEAGTNEPNGDRSAIGDGGRATRKRFVPNALALFAFGLLFAAAATALAQTVVNSSDVASEIGRLQDRDPKVRAAAARAIGNMGRVAEPLGVVPALVSALKDPSDDVRYSAAFALGAIGGGEATPISSAELRAQTVTAAVPALIDVLRPETKRPAEGPFRRLAILKLTHRPRPRIWQRP